MEEVKSKSTTGASKNSLECVGFIRVPYRCDAVIDGEGALLKFEAWLNDDEQAEIEARALGTPSSMFVPFKELLTGSDVPECGKVYKVNILRMADGSLCPANPYTLRKIEANRVGLTLKN